MAWFQRKKSYDRSRLLSQATRARRKRRFQKALELYREVLAREPENADIHRKVAPLLAKTKQPAAALASYRRAAEGLRSKGFVDQAIGVIREASGHLPREVEVWTHLAELEMERERPVDAHRVLVQGRRRFRARRDRGRAIQLLLRARRIAPDDFETTYDLARLFAKSGAQARAHALLEELVPRAHRRQLRKLRRRQLLVSPSLGGLWRYVRAIFGRR